MQSRNLRLSLFGGLYFTQGVTLSFILTFNILYLGEAGYGPGEVGLLQGLLLVPFILKIFLGILSDGVNLFGLGHRHWIVSGRPGAAMGERPSRKWSGNA